MSVKSTVYTKKRMYILITSVYIQKRRQSSVCVFSVCVCVCVCVYVCVCVCVSSMCVRMVSVCIKGYTEGFQRF